MQQAPSICCAILSWTQLRYGLWFPEAGLLTTCPLALTRHRSPRTHTHLYSLIKSGPLQLNARQYFFQKILCLRGSSLGVPHCGLKALCAWKKSSLFVQSPAHQSLVWDWGSWALLQVHFGQRLSETMMQGAHQPLEMLSLTSAALVLALPDTTEAFGSNKADTPQT